MRHFFCLIILLFSCQVWGGSLKESKSIYAVKSIGQIILDGKLSEAPWKNQPVNEFTQRDPAEGAPSSEKINVWIAYDEENLYVAAKLFDSDPDLIDARLARRDGAYDTDWFMIYLDTYNDKKTGYYFGVNAGGSIMDGTLFNDSWDDDSWDGIWKAATSITSDGWTVEMQIPFSQLRFKDSDKLTWGTNFQRFLKRKNEKSYYVMVPKKESGFVSHFASLEGIEGIKSKQRFEILPYFVQKAQYLVHDPKDPFYKGNQYKTSFGADAKIGFGSNITLDLTFNPDFGQVEVDPAVVNLSAFETYYSEKRPFFIEGSNIFNFGFGGSNNFWGFNFGNPDLIYSRRIGRAPQGSVRHEGFVNYSGETRILGAAKLTGKIDESWSIGAITAVTEKTFAQIDSSGIRFEDEIEPFTVYNVIRTQKEFNKGRSALGLILTSTNRALDNQYLKDRLAQNAFVFGLDGWNFLDDDETYVLTANVIGSYTNGTKEYLTRLQKRPYRYMQRPDASFAVLDSNRTSLAGWFSRIMLNKQKGSFYINSAIGAVSPGFEYNDLGMQYWSEKINGHLVLGYRWYDPDSLFRRKSVNLAYCRDIDFEGNTLRNGLMIFTSGQFLNYYNFYLNLGYNAEAYSKTLTRGGPLAALPDNYSLSFGGHSDSREKVMVEVNGYIDGNAIGSSYYETSLYVEWKPNTQINLSFGPEYSRSHSKRQWVGRFDDVTAVNTYGVRYIFGELKQETISASLRLNWTFTPALSLQLYLQPLFSVGEYSRFSEFAKPRTLDYNDFGKNGSTISYDAENSEYTVDPDGNGPAEKFVFGNPNFNFKSLRGTAVLRWEVLPGSVFYLVWSHNQVNFDDPGSFSFGRDFNKLITAEADNILMAKFSYWLDI